MIKVKVQAQQEQINIMKKDANICCLFSKQQDNVCTVRREHHVYIWRQWNGFQMTYNITAVVILIWKVSMFKTLHFMGTLHLWATDIKPIYCNADFHKHGVWSVSRQQLPHRELSAKLVVCRLNTLQIIWDSPVSLQTTQGAMRPQTHTQRQNCMDVSYADTHSETGLHGCVLCSNTTPHPLPKHKK